MSSQPLWEDPEADAVNAARDALKATTAGRLWYVQRHRHPRIARWLRRLVRSKADRYDAAMLAHFHGMAADLGLPVLTTKPLR
jgi:hypothetical protein